MREIRIDKLDKRAEASLNSLDPSRMIAPICSDNALRVYARPTHTHRARFFFHRALSSMSVAFSRNPFVARHYRRKTCYPCDFAPNPANAPALLSPLKFVTMTASRRVDFFYVKMGFPLLRLHETLAKAFERQISRTYSVLSRSPIIDSIFQNRQQPLRSVAYIRWKESCNAVVRETV